MQGGKFCATGKTVRVVEKDKGSGLYISMKNASNIFFNN